jgi:nucleoside-diphosphate-sugar epimerase
VNVLITGADGFAGTWLARELLGAGHRVGGTTLREGVPADTLLSASERAAIEWRRMELGDPEQIRRALAPHPGQPWDGIVHLAGIAWSRDAADHPGQTQDINVRGTARVIAAAAVLRRDGIADPVVINASSAEVYGMGQGQRARSELDPPAPLSPYAVSKLEAEQEADQVAAQSGLHLIHARLFPHIGPGQRPVFVVPALLGRLREARNSGAAEIPTGDLSPVRDFLDVRDVASAYRSLLERGAAPGVYNVASGIGRTLQSVFDRLAELVGARARARYDAGLGRPWDLPHLVGDAAKLRQATGWSPRLSFEQTLTDLVHAEAH